MCSYRWVSALNSGLFSRVQIYSSRAPRRKVRGYNIRVCNAMKPNPPTALHVQHIKYRCVHGSFPSYFNFVVNSSALEKRAAQKCPAIIIYTVKIMLCIKHDVAIVSPLYLHAWTQFLQSVSPVLEALVLQ